MSNSTKPPPAYVEDSSADVIAETLAGDIVSLPGAAALVPRDPERGPMSPSTVFRWVHKGCKSPSGTLIKLEACRWGCRWMTSRAALGRFLRALSGEAATQQGVPTTGAATPTKKPAVSSKREKEISDAVEELKRRL